MALLKQKAQRLVARHNGQLRAGDFEKEWLKLFGSVLDFADYGVGSIEELLDLCSPFLWQVSQPLDTSLTAPCTRRMVRRPLVDVSGVKA